MSRRLPRTSLVEPTRGPTAAPTREQLMTSTTANRRTGPGAIVRPAVHLPSCGCGQALDFCRTGHCPRCGVTLGARCRADVLR